MIPYKPEHKQLAAFYAVTSLEALVDAMELHIEKLQAKLREIQPTPSFPPQGVRGG